MKLLTLNTHSLREENQEQKLEWFLEAVMAEKPDIIALQEVIWAGQAFMKGTQGISGAIWPLFFTAIYYLIFSGILTVLLSKLEQKLDYFR